MSIRIPRLGLPRWLALIIAGIVVFTGLWFYPEPHDRGPFTRRIGFCIESKDTQWAAACASDRPPEPTAQGNANIRGLIIFSGENTRGWKMTLYQQSRAQTTIESHSDRLTEQEARATVDGIRAELAAAADSVIAGAGLAITAEPHQISRTLWANVLHRVVFIALIGGLWWILGRPGNERM